MCVLSICVCLVHVCVQYMCVLSTCVCSVYVCAQYMCVLSKTVLFSIRFKLLFANANHTQCRDYAFILSALFQDRRQTQDVAMLAMKRAVVGCEQQ